MKKRLRQSMAWMHTWSGLTVGWIMFFVFVTGTIGYFYPEIDRWMEPERPLASNQNVTPIETQMMLSRAESYLNKTASDAERWQINFPVGRYAREEEYFPNLLIRVSPFDGSDYYLIYDLVHDSFLSSESIEKNHRETGGAYALYRTHRFLHYVPRDIGRVVILICSLVLLVVLISGVVTHKKIFLDFFTFRKGVGQRAWLDAHNISSVTALPFMLMITYSGLAFYPESLHIDAPVNMLYDGNDRVFRSDGHIKIEQNELIHSPDNHRSVMRPLTYFLSKGWEYWDNDSSVRYMEIRQPGNSNSEVHLQRTATDILLRPNYEQLHFSGYSGQLIRQISRTNSFSKVVESSLYGLHEGVFAGPALRWLYFGAGSLGCIMIGSGLVLWTVKRRRKQEKIGRYSFGFRLVETLNIGTIAGLLVGVAVYFWANRLLPVGMESRADWEMHCLFIIWGATFVYAALRSPARAWVEVFGIGAALYIFLPVLNALTTDRHLGVTLPAGDWVLAGFDLTVFVFGIALAVIAWKVHRRDALQQSSDQAAAVKTPALVGSSG